MADKIGYSVQRDAIVHLDDLYKDPFRDRSVCLIKNLSEDLISHGFVDKSPNITKVVFDRSAFNTHMSTWMNQTFNKISDAATAEKYLEYVVNRVFRSEAAKVRLDSGTNTGIVKQFRYNSEEDQYEMYVSTWKDENLFDLTSSPAEPQESVLYIQDSAELGDKFTVTVTSTDIPGSTVATAEYVVQGNASTVEDVRDGIIGALRSSDADLAVIIYPEGRDQIRMVARNGEIGFTVNSSVTNVTAVPDEERNEISSFTNTLNDTENGVYRFEIQGDTLIGDKFEMDILDETFEFTVDQLNMRPEDVVDELVSQINRNANLSGVVEAISGETSNEIAIYTTEQVVGQLTYFTRAIDRVDGIENIGPEYVIIKEKTEKTGEFKPVGFIIEMAEELYKELHTETVSDPYPDYRQTIDMEYIDRSEVESGTIGPIVLETEQLSPLSGGVLQEQPWRIKFDVSRKIKAKSFDEYQADKSVVPFLDFNIATEYQIFENGECSQNNYRANPFRINKEPGFLGFFKVSPEDSTDIENIGFYKHNSDGDSSNPITYRLTITEHGILFYILNPISTEYNNAWFVVQRHVFANDDLDKGVERGQPNLERTAPLHCIYQTSEKHDLYDGQVNPSLYDTMPSSLHIKRFIVREKDIINPWSEHKFASVNEVNSNAIMNAETQLSINEDSEFVLNFPNRLTSKRYLFTNSELDMFAYCDAGVIAQGTLSTTSRYGTERTYQAMSSTEPNGNGVRILVLVKGEGVVEDSDVL